MQIGLRGGAACTAGFDTVTPCDMRRAHLVAFSSICGSARKIWRVRLHMRGRWQGALVYISMRKTSFHSTFRIFPSSVEKKACEPTHEVDAHLAELGVHRDPLPELIGEGNVLSEPPSPTPAARPSGSTVSVSPQILRTPDSKVTGNQPRSAVMK